jgi:glycosyltransferase involved in cell wall biosynthesis
MTFGISTIIPTFNNGATVARAIDSALAQDCSDHEVVVVNDGSTDSTSGILERYGLKIRVVNQPNRGAAAARNAGAVTARGQYFAFLDADDIWTSGKLKQMLAILEKNQGAALAFSNFRRILPSGREIDICEFGASPSMKELLTRRSRIVPSAVLMRRDAFERSGGFCEEFDRNYFEDSLMWILAREQGSFELIREPLTVYSVRTGPIPPRYFSNGQLFIKLVRKRYGKSAANLIKETYNDLSLVALQEASHLLDRGQFGAFLRTMAQAAHFRPSVLADPSLGTRLFRVRNMRRLLGGLSMRVNRTR